MLKPPKRKLGSFVQRYCLNFGLRSAVNYSQQGCRVHRTDDLELVFLSKWKKITIFLSLTVCENTKNEFTEILNKRLSEYFKVFLIN